MELRIGHKLYKEWILSRYPGAAAFPWEKEKSRITDPAWLKLIKKVLMRGPDKLFYLLGRGDKARQDMNPLDFWLRHNEPVRKYLDDYEKAGYAFLPPGCPEELEKDMHGLYISGTAQGTDDGTDGAGFHEAVFWRGDGCLLILYISYIDFKPAQYGASLRPQKMYQAFQEEGHRVKLLAGSQERWSLARRRASVRGDQPLAGREPAGPVLHRVAGIPHPVGL